MNEVLEWNSFVSWELTGLDIAVAASAIMTYFRILITKLEVSHKNNIHCLQAAGPCRALHIAVLIPGSQQKIRCVFLVPTAM